MILADKIIENRKKNGWSQEDLAAQLDVSRQSVSKWESGASQPDLDKVLAMSRIFGVSTDALLKDELDDLGPAPRTDLLSGASLSGAHTLPPYGVLVLANPPAAGGKP